MSPQLFLDGKLSAANVAELGAILQFPAAAITEQGFWKRERTGR